jgi:hypothetical protein
LDFVRPTKDKHLILGFLLSCLARQDFCFLGRRGKLMETRRFIIELQEPEVKALARLAIQERRAPRDQAAFIIVSDLLKRGMLDATLAMRPAQSDSVEPIRT